MLFYEVLSGFGLFTSSLTNSCWVALSSCIVWSGSSLWGVSLGLQMPSLLLYRAQTRTWSGGLAGSSAGSIFRLVPSGLMVALGSFPEGVEAWALVLLNVFLWQSAAETGGVHVPQCLWAMPNLAWLISEIPRLCRLGQFPHMWQPPGDWNPPIDHP